MSFKPPRDRDAWATIRGYVYQVGLTIIRWLELKDGETLELECGEDIDLVSGALSGGATEEARLIEQVKHLESSVTLKTSAAVAAIANAIDHRRAHLGMNLKFRFTTTALVGQEQKSPIPDGDPGISAWDRVHRSDAPPSAALLAGIRHLLKEAKQPVGFPDPVWQNYQDFVTSAKDEEFLELLKTFEWSCGADSPTDLEALICNKLMEGKLASDEEQAKQQRERLYFHVFKVLSERGSKQLTVADRTKLLTVPTLSATDHAQLQELKGLMSSLEQRVERVEQQGILTRAQVEVLAKKMGIDAAVEYTVNIPVMEIPPLTSPLAHRPKTVAKIIDAIKRHPWTVLRRDSGGGKTQLAVLTSCGVGTCQAWVRLRDLTIEQACTRLDAIACRISGLSPEIGPEKLYEAMCRTVGTGAMLVVEDVPQLSGDDELSVRLLCLARICQACGVSLLSTTWYGMPMKISEACGHTMLSVLEPELSDEEAGELLAAYGAPEHLRKSGPVAFLNTIARRHPLLLAAVARYLADAGWKFTEHSFDGLLRGEHALSVNMNTLRQLLTKVEDKKTRELVYRLNLIGTDFPLADVDLLATVQPTIDMPRERISSVLGICVQSDTKDGFVVSPLVASLGTGDLDGIVRKKCHMVLGGELFRQRTVTPLEVMRCITHFHQAEAWDIAGVGLSMALSKLAEVKRPVDDCGILSIWSNASLPDGMPLSLRINIRALQIHLMHEKGRPVKYLVDDLDRLIGHATSEDAWSVLAACTYAGPVIGETNLTLANKHLSTALRLMPGARLPDGKPLVLPKELKPEGLIWLNASNVKSPADLTGWIETLEELSEDQRKIAFEDPLTEDGCKIVVDSLLLKEGDKPKDQQNWKAVADALIDFVRRAKNLKRELLWACATRALILVQGRSLKDTNIALETGKAALAEASNDPRVQFVITQGLGEQFLVAGKHAEALDWLKQAVECATDAYPSVRMQALVEASCAVGPVDANKAVEYATLAVHMAEKSADIHPVDAVKPHAELAYAYFLAGDVQAAFRAWDKAAELLLACQSDTDYWKELFVLFGHVSGYLTTLICSGTPPSRTADDEPYGEPRRGMFYFYDARVISIFNVDNIPVVCAQLAMFAEGVGQDDKAFSWAVRGMEKSKQAGNTTAFASNSLQTLHHHLTCDKYEEALLTALEATAIIIAAAKRSKEDRQTARFKFDINAVLGSKPNDDWKRAERFAVTHALIPALFRLGSLAVKDPDATSKKAAVLVASCREIAQDAADPELWSASADLADQMFIRRVPAEELFRRSDTFDKDKQAAELTICLLGASLQDDVSLANAARLHLAILPTIQTEMGTSPAIYRSTILPFLADFWRHKLQSQRFNFSAPVLVEGAFNEALKSKEPQRAQKILGAIADDLRVTLNTKDRAWLRKNEAI